MTSANSKTFMSSRIRMKNHTNVGPVLQLFYLSGPCGTLKNPHQVLCKKSRGHRPGGVAFTHGLGGYSKLLKDINGLRAAWSGTFVC